VRVCIYFAKNACKFGKKCPLRHETDKNQMPTCRNFLRGCCSAVTGQCPFAHTRVSRDAKICQAYQKVQRAEYSAAGVHGIYQDIARRGCFVRKSTSGLTRMPSLATTLKLLMTNLLIIRLQKTRRSQEPYLLRDCRRVHRQ